MNKTKIQKIATTIIGVLMVVGFQATVFAAENASQASGTLTHPAWGSEKNAQE